MEEQELAACSPEVACWDHLDRAQSAMYVDSFGTEIFVSELKKHSSVGCLLCSLEDSLEEDWDDA
jgi:hypothetical protein